MPGRRRPLGQPEVEHLRNRGINCDSPLTPLPQFGHNLHCLLARYAARRRAENRSPHPLAAARRSSVFRSQGKDRLNCARFSRQRARELTA